MSLEIGNGLCRESLGVVVVVKLLLFVVSGEFFIRFLGVVLFDNIIEKAAHFVDNTLIVALLLLNSSTRASESN